MCVCVCVCVFFLVFVYIYDSQGKMRKGRKGDCILDSEYQQYSEYPIVTLERGARNPSRERESIFQMNRMPRNICTFLSLLPLQAALS